MLIDQAGLPAGSPGQARTDGLATGALVTLTSTGGGSTHRFRLLWVPPEDTTAVGSLTQTGPTTWTFSPDVGVYGTYRIELIVDEGLSTESRQVRAFVIRTPGQGLIIPAANETADPTTNLANVGPAAVQRSEQNEPFGPFTGGSAWGWWRAFRDLVMVADAGGSGGTLQAAYDGGQTIDQSASAATIAITAGTSTAVVMSLARSTPGSANVLEVTRAPTMSLQAGDGIAVTMGANAIGRGIAVEHSGSGAAVTASADGTGNSATFTTSGALGFGVSVEMTDTANANDALAVQHVGEGRAIAATAVGVQSPVAALISTGADELIETQLRCVDSEGDATLVVSNDTVEIGTSTAPIPLVAHAWAAFNGEVTNGVDHTSNIRRTYAGYTTPAVVTTLSQNNQGQLLWRAGTRTADSTIADLAHRAGSDGVEVLLTKGGRVNAECTLVEWPIVNGQTISPGDAVAVTSGGRVRRAQAGNNAHPGFIGICLVGGTGDAGGNVYALVATSGTVRAMAGLTAGSPVFLSTSSPGAVQMTVPTGAGNLSLQIGYALDATTMVIHVEGRVVL